MPEPSVRLRRVLGPGETELTCDECFAELDRYVELRLAGGNANETIVIAGASLAGAKAAETLRAEGFDGRVVLAGAEPDRPYERPPLSKDYLRGESERDKVFVHDQSFY